MKYVARRTVAPHKQLGYRDFPAAETEDFLAPGTQGLSSTWDTGTYQQLGHGDFPAPGTQGLPSSWDTGTSQQLRQWTSQQLERRDFPAAGTQGLPSSWDTRYARLRGCAQKSDAVAGGAAAAGGATQHSRLLAVSAAVRTAVRAAVRTVCSGCSECSVCSAGRALCSRLLLTHCTHHEDSTATARYQVRQHYTAPGEAARHQVRQHCTAPAIVVEWYAARVLYRVSACAERLRAGSKPGNEYELFLVSRRELALIGPSVLDGDPHFCVCRTLSIGWRPSLLCVQDPQYWIETLTSVCAGPSVLDGDPHFCVCRTLSIGWRPSLLCVQDFFRSQTPLCSSSTSTLPATGAALCSPAAAATHADPADGGGCVLPSGGAPGAWRAAPHQFFRTENRGTGHHICCATASRHAGRSFMLHYICCTAAAADRTSLAHLLRAARCTAVQPCSSCSAQRTTAVLSCTAVFAAAAVFCASGVPAATSDATAADRACTPAFLQHLLLHLLTALLGLGDLYPIGDDCLFSKPGKILPAMWFMFLKNSDGVLGLTRLLRCDPPTGVWTAARSSQSAASHNSQSAAASMTSFTAAKLSKAVVLSFILNASWSRYVQLNIWYSILSGAYFLLTAQRCTRSSVVVRWSQQLQLGVMEEQEEVIVPLVLNAVPPVASLLLLLGAYLPQLCGDWSFESQDEDVTIPYTVVEDLVVDAYATQVSDSRIFPTCDAGGQEG
ncbi:hypothetical protein FHG87_016089 [Trinorchestia longiramus]|nr:hypothetical protein FHG87_016089 [Trinorchestia longiramus]